MSVDSYACTCVACCGESKCCFSGCSLGEPMWLRASALLGASVRGWLLLSVLMARAWLAVREVSACCPEPFLSSSTCRDTSLSFCRVCEQ